MPRRTNARAGDGAPGTGGPARARRRARKAGVAGTGRRGKREGSGPDDVVGRVGKAGALVLCVRVRKKAKKKCWRVRVHALETPPQVPEALQGRVGEPE